MEANRTFEWPVLVDYRPMIQACLFVSAGSVKLVNSKVVAIKGHRVSGKDRSSHRGSGA